jgi:hypothetical protein
MSDATPTRLEQLPESSYDQPMTAPIVGRDEQLARAHALLDDEESTMRALVIDGEAGIGKTTICARRWRALVRGG